MSAPAYGPDKVLCHCPDAGEDGHALGTAGCAALKITRASRSNPIPYASMAAAGTCPKCGRTGVRVTAPMREGSQGPGYPFRVPLGRELVLAEHRTPGRGGVPCEGAGHPPAETRFTPSPDIARWRELHGPESVR